ncbi:hypothetical protein HGM15179_008540 [Zosterops borbonicus]|uniref:Uncharacterized protein n=1 Tax=Zosterops borbonicus TaxID=364589 RepID=A0A8K1GHI4_9PASS|nr:hypothetical protein HGM15179_008540 [Zosterops borbonicus]
MGCGGSRADAIEPRYYESWTRETESTWLTNTDSESPPQEGGSAEGPGREQGGPRPEPKDDDNDGDGNKERSAKVVAHGLFGHMKEGQGHHIMHKIVSMEGDMDISIIQGQFGSSEDKDNDDD